MEGWEGHKHDEEHRVMLAVRFLFSRKENQSIRENTPRHMLVGKKYKIKGLQWRCVIKGGREREEETRRDEDRPPLVSAAPDLSHLAPAHSSASAHSASLPYQPPCAPRSWSHFPLVLALSPAGCCSSPLPSVGRPHPAPAPCRTCPASAPRPAPYCLCCEAVCAVRFVWLAASPWLLGV